MISRRLLLGGLGAATVLGPRLAQAAGAPRVLTAPIALQGNRVLLSVVVNGGSPLLFVLDSGGVVGLIRDDVAKRLRLPVLRQSTLGGAGGRARPLPALPARFGRDRRGVAAAGDRTVRRGDHGVRAGRRRVAGGWDPDHL